MPGSLIQGNALHTPLKDKSVQLCCFSPPYWNLRKYSVMPIIFGDPNCSHVWGKTIKQTCGRGDSLEKTPGFNGYEGIPRKFVPRGRFCKKCGAWQGQMGLEPNIGRYLDNLMLAMAEVWRVLRDDGVCFVNIGDSYWNASGSCRSPGGRKSRIGAGKKNAEIHPLHRGNKFDNPGLRPKTLCLIPQKFAIRCQEAGWIVRSEVIFHKLNPIPESCTDRPTKSHEQVWLLTKSGKYFWDKDAVREPHKDIARPKGFSGRDGVGQRKNNQGWYGGVVSLDKHRNYNSLGRNLRSVWTMATEPHPEAHFATFPSKLVDTMIKAGSSPRACEICGAPWVRILKKDAVQCSECKEAQYAGKYYKEGRRSAGRRVLKNIAELRAQGKDHDNPFPRIRTVGWRKTCKCDCAGTGRCVVFDPFVGIGTTVVMAEKQGRAGVGMDLSLEYLIDIALKKIRVPVQKMLELRF